MNIPTKTGNKKEALRSLVWVNGNAAVFACPGKAPRVRYGFRGIFGFSRTALFWRFSGRTEEYRGSGKDKGIPYPTKALL